MKKLINKIKRFYNIIKFIIFSFYWSYYDKDFIESIDINNFIFHIVENGELEYDIKLFNLIDIKNIIKNSKVLDNLYYVYYMISMSYTNNKLYKYLYINIKNNNISFSYGNYYKKFIRYRDGFNTSISIDDNTIIFIKNLINYIISYRNCRVYDIGIEVNNNGSMCISSYYIKYDISLYELNKILPSKENLVNGLYVLNYIKDIKKYVIQKIEDSNINKNSIILDKNNIINNLYPPIEFFDVSIAA